MHEENDSPGSEDVAMLFFAVASVSMFDPWQEQAWFRCRRRSVFSCSRIVPLSTMATGNLSRRCFSCAEICSVSPRCIESIEWNVKRLVFPLGKPCADRSLVRAAELGSRSILSLLLNIFECIYSATRKKTCENEVVFAMLIRNAVDSRQ